MPRNKPSDVHISSHSVDFSANYFSHSPRPWKQFRNRDQIPSQKPSKHCKQLHVWRCQISPLKNYEAQDFPQCYIFLSQATNRKISIVKWQPPLCKHYVKPSRLYTASLYGRMRVSQVNFFSGLSSSSPPNVALGVSFNSYTLIFEAQQWQFTGRSTYMAGTLLLITQHSCQSEGGSWEMCGRYNPLPLS